MDKQRAIPFFIARNAYGLNRISGWINNNSILEKKKGGKLNE